ncbi:hypothetical protein HKX48_003283 [Thoreauomyces humboldtii]|nr:hypothetical protein HKX48_003283 [Thoreauomyces humboldtii]
MSNNVISSPIVYYEAGNFLNVFGGEIACDRTMEVWRSTKHGLEFAVRDKDSYMYTYSFCEDFSRQAELLVRLTAPVGAVFTITAESGDKKLGLGSKASVDSSKYVTFDDNATSRTLRIPFSDLTGFHPAKLTGVTFNQFSVFGDRHPYTLHEISFDGPEHLTFYDLFQTGAVSDDMSSLNNWVDASQGGGPENYRVEDGKMVFSVDPDAAVRPKLRYKGYFGQPGRHEWRVYIPTRVRGDIVSASGFLYATDYKEFDFEIGYGAADVRASLNAQPDDLVAYLTTQATDGSSWASTDQRKVLMKGNKWSDLALDLSVDERGHYVVRWYIDGILQFTSQQRWGPKDLDRGFRSLVSLENLWWIGAEEGVTENPGPRRNRGRPPNTATFASYTFVPR